MAKNKLPVAKAGGPVATDPGIKVSDKYAEEDRRYRAKDAASTLARAEEIRRDKSLMKDVKAHVKMMNKACS
jgi:hypothetical protein